MEENIKKFLNIILEEATPLIATLNKGVGAAQIMDFERDMGVCLPEDVKTLYQNFNGQKNRENVFFIDGLRWLPMEEIKEKQQDWLRILEKQPNWEELSFDEEEAIDMGWDKAIKNQFYNPKWLPFLTDGSRFMFIDLDPDTNGVYGQIGEIDLVLGSISDSFMDIVDNSLLEWFESLNEDIDEGIVFYDEGKHSLVDHFMKDYSDDVPNIFAPEPDYVSSGGSNVYNYSAENRTDFVLPDRSCVYMEEICNHFERYIGEVDSVFHEIISEYAHIDVHWIKPTEKRPYHVLFTTGMSDYPMYLPKDIEDPTEYSHAELMVYLPADWKIGNEAFEQDDNYWPVYFLKMIARFPHQYKTWMGEGHTIPNGPNAEPIANTNFACILLMPPYLSEKEAFLKLHTEDRTTINFYSLLPLYVEEMDLKLEEGVETLLELFEENQISEVIDVQRKNVAL